jgi:hypothetical protein
MPNYPIDKCDADEAVQTSLDAAERIGVAKERWFANKAREAIQRTIDQGNGIPAEEVVARLEAKLAAARVRTN